MPVPSQADREIEIAPVGRHASVFERGSNVLEYWLAHAEGFEVAPRMLRRRRVERVVLDPAGGHAKAVIVRSSFRRSRQLLPADAVVGVDAFARVLHVDGPQPRHAPRAALASAGARAGRQVVPLLLGATAAALAALAWLQPRVRAGGRGARRAAFHARVGLAWLRPRVQARARGAGAAAAALAAVAAESSRAQAQRVAERRRRR
jgi:hypothetical protein